MRLPGFTAEASAQNRGASFRSISVDERLRHPIVTMAACPPGTRQSCQTTTTTTCSCTPAAKCVNPIARSCDELNCAPETPCCPWCPRCMTQTECNMYAPA